MNLIPYEKYSSEYLTSKIPKSQNSFAICYNNNLNTFLRPVFQYFKNLPPKKGQQLNDPALKCSPKLHTSHMNKEIYTSLSNL